MRRLTLVLMLLACGAPGVVDDAGGAFPDGGTVDAGDLDAGAADAGSADAGVRDGGSSTDAGVPDAGARDGGGLDAGTPDAGPTLVTVSSERELRGVWLATVSNLDWPASTGLSPAQGRASLDDVVTRLAAAGVNALFFQVRPESDALYASSLEPWSRFLSGTQGLSPGWDPLATLLELAHARGLEVHAWLNPYRGLVSRTAQAAANHVTRTLASEAIAYNGQVVMNPASAQVQLHVLAVVRDLLDHYDVDGLHFDDYFYPYPDASNTPFPDDAAYQGYLADGGTAPRSDWRRDNVNSLVSAVMETIALEHPAVRFGISPFGIYRSGTPAGITGLSGVEVLYCDSLRWMSEGWVDYLAPQLYWPTTQHAQSFTTLATWWASIAAGGRHVFPGHAATNLGSTSAWSLAEYTSQVAVTRTLRPNGAQGDLHFRASPLLANRLGVLEAFSTTLYATPALTPVVPRAGASTVPPVPRVELGALAITVTVGPPASTRFFALYSQSSNGTWQLRQVVGANSGPLAVSTGVWAVTAVAPGGAESQGVRVVVP